MKLKQYSGRIIRITAFILMFILTFAIADYVFMSKENSEYVATFNDEKENTLDVLLFGSSHMYRSVMTMELWNQFGIAAYNLGSSEQSLPLSYHLLEMALLQQKPKLVVVDAYMAYYQKPYVSPARAHHVFDNMPRSRAWYEGVFDIVPAEDRLRYIIPFSEFHSRWSDLEERDFKSITSNQKGSQYNTELVPFEPYTLIDKNQTAEIPEIPKKYLQKIIDTCKAHGIALQLVVMPYPEPQKKHQLAINAVEQMAKEQGIPFENLLDDVEVMDIRFETDYSDVAHVNLMGAYKATRYLGSMLQQEYDLPDHRNDPAYASWHDDFRAYADECFEEVRALPEKTRNIFLPFLENWYAA